MRYALPLVVVAGLISACPESRRDADATTSEQEAPGFTKAEVTRIAKLLGEVRAQPTWPKNEAENQLKQQTQAAFEEGLAAIREAHAGRDVLSYVAGWIDVFGRVAARDKQTSPDEPGRIHNKSVSRKVQGRTLEVPYGLYVPPGYDPTQRWPLLLALHPKDGDGPSYVASDWTDPARCPPELRNRFIILAPTIGEHVTTDGAQGRRIEPFSALHKALIAWTLVQVLEKYHVDTDRMYVEGKGSGGEAAAWLGTMNPQLFAAIGVRAANPDANRHVVSNLLSTDRMFVVGGPGETDPAEISTARVARHLLSRTRKLYGPELSYETFDARLFRRSAWCILDTADADPALGTRARIKASLDRPANRVKVEAENVSSFRIYLNDLLLDLDRPVTVVVNGEVLVQKKVERNLQFMLNHNSKNHIDPSLMAVGVLRVAIPK